METRFEWDPAKARRNETATEVFSDPFIATQEDIDNEGEQNLWAIGRTKSQALLVVVFVDRSQPDVEIIRFICPKRGRKYEQSTYQDQFR